MNKKIPELIIEVNKYKLTIQIYDLERNKNVFRTFNFPLDSNSELMFNYYDPEIINVCDEYNNDNKCDRNNENEWCVLCYGTSHNYTPLEIMSIFNDGLVGKYFSEIEDDLGEYDNIEVNDIEKDIVELDDEYILQYIEEDINEANNKIIKLNAKINNLLKYKRKLQDLKLNPHKMYNLSENALEKYKKDIEIIQLKSLIDNVKKIQNKYKNV